MPASDAVTTAGVARREVRNSLARLEFHLDRGTRGTRGVAREVRFLNALHESAAIQGSRAVGVRPLVGGPSFGNRARAALATGNAGTIGRMKSSLLADFSADALQAPRELASTLNRWVWTANASACASCLNDHGNIFTGIFVPNHPSCLCIGQPVGTPGLGRLSDSELISVHRQFGDPRYNARVDAFERGDISRAELAQVEAVNQTVRGLQAVRAHAAEGNVQTGLPAGIAADSAASIQARNS